MPLLYIGPLRALLIKRIFVARPVVEFYLLPARKKSEHISNIDITIKPVSGWDFCSLHVGHTEATYIGC
jgi:hypothetical protein